MASSLPPTRPSPMPERERWRTAIVDQVRDRVRTVGAHAGRLTR
jgi:hypothetical protein